MSEKKPKDLLVRFGSGNVEEELRVKKEPMEVELNLGLSLGGSFGEDKSKGLLRASSISAFSFLPEEEKMVVVVEKGESKGGLVRTCSLPVETGEERRKRKEMQCLRRMEAKRKRFEKRGWKREGGERVQDVDGVVRRGCCSRSPIGGCATSSSDYDCRPMEGLDISTLGSSSAEARSPADSKPPATLIDRIASLPPATHIDRTASLPPATPNSSKEEIPTAPSKLVSMGSNCSHEMVKAMSEKMPCVSTRGDGPNGKQVKGFLYRYAKGEEVRIVCVCCGSFLTPAEFVKHGGGGDVEFPLRHIVVYPS